MIKFVHTRRTTKPRLTMPKDAPVPSTIGAWESGLAKLESCPGGGFLKGTVERSTLGGSP